MLSKNKIKNIRYLHSKKGRDETGTYIAEGDRIVAELIANNAPVIEIIALPHWISINARLCKNHTVTEVSANEIKAVSTLQTPQNVLCIVNKKQYTFNIGQSGGELILALDTIQDPGNMGTIIRLANWFGIKTILCSPETVDVYNPKVIQSTMGAINQCNIIYCNLHETLIEYRKTTGNNIYGTFLHRENIYAGTFTNHAIVVLGNEGNGISPEIEALVTHKITIPSFGNSGIVESLNVSVAASIICSEFRRNDLSKSKNHDSSN